MKKSIFLLIIIYTSNQYANAQTWSTVGSGISGYGRIEAMCEYNGELYVGGAFDTIGGLPVNSIARWNGSTWDSVPGTYSLTNYLGAFLNFEIFDMIIYNGELVIAGLIWQNGNQVTGIAKWNGSTWSQLGNGLDNRVFALEVYNGELYVAGHLEHAGSVIARGIARWNGTTWNQVGGQGLNFSPGFFGNALQIYNGELYLGGGFNYINGIPINHLAKWNGVDWDSVPGSNFWYSVESLGIYNNRLYMGGFHEYNNGMIHRITSWDNVTRDSVGTGLKGIPVCYANYNNELYCAGQFDTAGGVPALGIARWNDAAWQDVGGGLSLYNTNVDTSFTPPNHYEVFHREMILSMCVYNNDLYVGGTFEQVGGVTAHSIAKWHTTTSITENENDFNFSLYPNPSSGNTTIYIDEKLSNATLTIYDVLGNVIMKPQLVSGNHFEFRDEAFFSGIYFITLKQDNKITTKKLVKL